MEEVYNFTYLWGDKTVIVIEGYHICHLYEEFYPTFISEGLPCESTSDQIFCFCHVRKKM
jgi:hypothetical protein